jgi:hypothetical protein
MGLLEPHGRHGPRDRRADLTAGTIIVHSLDHALAAAGTAATLGVPLTLRSAAGAGGTVGVGWFAALAELVRERYPLLPISFVLDCADEAGTALGAFRRGVKRVRFAGSPEAAAKLAAIAASCGAALDDDPNPTLDLLGEADPEAACRRWLTEGIDNPHDTESRLVVR